MTPTIHNFEIELSDVDRGVYETLALRVARHPSETEDYLVTRVLAYCLEYADGISFSNGLAEPDEPPLAVRDLTGVTRVWIDIGGRKVPYLDGLVYPAVSTVAGQPATAFPVGRSREGLPIGLQVLAPYLEDRTPIRFASLLAREIVGYTKPDGYDV